MKKGQTGVNTFVKSAAVIIVLVVFILILPSFKNLLYGAVQTGECEWDLLFSAIMTTAGGGKMDVPPECKAEYVNVTMQDLQANLLLAQQRIKQYNLDETQKKKYADMRAAGFTDPDDYHQQMEWALNQVVADRLLWCWKRVWKGNLPLFDKWWNLVDWTFFGLKKGDYSQAELKVLRGAIEDESPKLFDVYGPPTFCIVCARIKFDSAVQSEFRGRKINSLLPWLAGNPVPGTKTSYLEELLEGQTVISPLYTPPYTYTTDEPMAVVYERINPHITQSTFTWATSKLGITDEAENVNILALAEYDKLVVSKHKGGESCFVIVD